MSMIKCPECGKEVSDLAESCPNCGFPLGYNAGNTPPNNNMYQQQNVAQPVKAYVHKPKKNSALGVIALILSILGITFFIGAIFAVIDLRKKDGKKKVLSIVSLFICAFWLIMAVSVGNDDSKSEVKTENKSAVTENTEVNDVKTEEKQEQKEKTPDPEPEKQEVVEDFEEETEDTEKDKYYVGETWKNKYVLVSFDECGVYESDNQFIQPASGNKFIYATFTFENIGSSDTTVAYWDFDCYADGYACEGAYLAGDGVFSQTLSAGRKIVGTIYYEVPTSAESVEIEYDPNFWTSEKIVFVYQ